MPVSACCCSWAVRRRLKRCLHDELALRPNKNAKTARKLPAISLRGLRGLCVFQVTISLHDREATQVLRRDRVAACEEPTLPTVVRTVHAALVRGPQLAGLCAGTQ